MKKILIIDDSLAFCKEIKLYLESEFLPMLEVEILVDGEKAATVVTALRPDLVILDIFFQFTDGADGEKVYEAIRNTESGANIPIIVLSAYITEGDAVEANKSSEVTKIYLRKSGSLTMLEEIAVLIKRLVFGRG